MDLEGIEGLAHGQLLEETNDACMMHEWYTYTCMIALHTADCSLLYGERSYMYKCDQSSKLWKIDNNDDDMHDV